MKQTAANQVGAPLLSCEKICKSFGATRALDSFSMTVLPGQIHALIGENGAGKSTFIKILAGIYKEDKGTIRFVANEGGRANIAFIHQDLGLIPSMTVAENIVLGDDYPRRARLVDWTGVETAAKAALDMLGVHFDPRSEVADLTLAERALVAIARALRRNARLLVLDEPTATLPGRDVELLFEALRHLAEQGIGIIYVSHRLREVLTIANHVTVVRDGHLFHSGPTNGLTEADLISFMSGKSSADRPRSSDSSRRNEPILTLKSVTTPQNLRGVDLVVGKGEIVGCVGLRGAGQEDLAKLLFGLMKSDGEILLEGRSYAARNPERAMRQGVVLISGDRTETTAGTMNLVENLFLNPRTSSLPSFFRSLRRERQVALEAIREYGVRPANADALISNLSGGNAQKLIVARGFDAGPKLVVLDEPTAGVDMPTRHAMYALMRRKADEGVGFLLTSSDHDEVAAVCDRIYVIANGRVAMELDQQPYDPEALGQLIHEVAL
jgi:ribose transport system ATP-binding protein